MHMCAQACTHTYTHTHTHTQRERERERKRETNITSEIKTLFIPLNSKPDEVVIK